MRILDSAFLALDAPPASWAWRVAVGFAIGVLWLRILGPGLGAWAIVPFFLFCLLALRVVPLVVRKGGQFPPDVLAAWRERRSTAKRFDSYQWQKLLWIGVGLALSLASSEAHASAVKSLALINIVAGLAGTVIWRSHLTAHTREHSGRATPAPPAKVRG